MQILTEEKTDFCEWGVDIPNKVRYAGGIKERSVMGQKWRNNKKLTDAKKVRQKSEKIWRRARKIAFKEGWENILKETSSRILMVALAITTLSVSILAPPVQASGDECPDIKFIFARGSGSPLNESEDYLVFRSTITEKITGSKFSYEFEDLPYPAKGVMIDNIWTLLGAFFGAGDAYDFGASVDDGVGMLTNEVNRSCPETKYVLGGYSQGAMVVSKAIHSIDASKVIYAATFGDPKIYLPEGKAWGAITPIEPITGSDKNLLLTGIIPDACKNENLSDYRVYVPDCYAYEGALGSYRPYQPEGYSGKLGTWCNTRDVFCSSYLSVASHVSYVADDLYEDASRFIVNKIAESYEMGERYVTPHDTVILIDSTGSMSSLILEYKAEAARLAKETLRYGGRVALFDYRDIADGYTPVERCNFDTCTMETFQAGLDAIVPSGGGDTPESLLSASKYVMNKFEWQVGATKSLVVLTDAGFHEPDLDGTTLDEVAKLSEEIDPVNFYIVTENAVEDKYSELAGRTGGSVVGIGEDIGALTDAIVARYDSLPRAVTSDADDAGDLPWLTVQSVAGATGERTVMFQTNGTRTLVALNDAVLGMTEETTIVISGVDETITNQLVLTPLSETRRGTPVAVTLSENGVLIPKTPNTGSFR